MEMPVMSDNADLQQEIAALTQKRDELRERLIAIERDYRQGLERDAEEQAIQLQNADVLEAIAKSTAAELERIEARLAELG